MPESTESSLNTINILAAALDQVNAEKMNLLAVLSGVLDDCEGCREAAAALVSGLNHPDDDDEGNTPEEEVISA